MSAQSGLAYRWLPDDTEESVLGADWHQEAITNVWSGLRDVARTRRLPWHVGNQLTLAAWHPDGTPWRPKPDIMVHVLAGPVRREEMSAQTDGLPALIIEVASPSTYISDVTTSAPTRERSMAKGFEYLSWPLPEYLVFDPTEALLPGQVRAWQVVEGQVRKWEPDPTGHYHSQTLGLAFRPEGVLLRIVDPVVGPIAFDHEKGDRLERLEQENAALHARIARLTDDKG